MNINLNLATVPGIAGASTVTSCAFIPATATFVPLSTGWRPA